MAAFRMSASLFRRSLQALRTSRGRRRSTTTHLVSLRSLAGVAVLGLVAVWLTGNLAREPTLFLQLMAIGLTIGGLYAMVALGFTLAYSIVDLINLPHGYVFVAGAVFSGNFLTQTLSVSGDTEAIALVGAIVLTLPLTMILCGLLSASIELIAYRPLRGGPRLAPLVTSVGVLFILDDIIVIWTRSSIVSIPSLLPEGAIFHLGHLSYRWNQLLVLVAVFVLLAALRWLTFHTLFGKAMRATAQNREAAALVGVNVNRTITATFFLAGALAGAGGLLSALYLTVVSWDQSLRLTLTAFTAAALGGIRSLGGAVVGALLIGLMETFNNGLDWRTPGPSWTVPLVMMTLILVLVFLPQGLFGGDEEGQHTL
jgi:branched-chain amino acid transport system permease protein